MSLRSFEVREPIQIPLAESAMWLIAKAAEDVKPCKSEDKVAAVQMFMSAAELKQSLDEGGDINKAYCEFSTRLSAYQSTQCQDASEHNLPFEVISLSLNFIANHKRIRYRRLNRRANQQFVQRDNFNRFVETRAESDGGLCFFFGDKGNNFSDQAGCRSHGSTNTSIS